MLQVLSDKEIECILHHKSRSNKVVEIFSELSEQYGLYEAEKSINAITNKSIVLSADEKLRASLEERTLMVTGDVRNNPEGLVCN